MPSLATTLRQSRLCGLRAPLDLLPSLQHHCPRDAKAHLHSKPPLAWCNKPPPMMDHDGGVPLPSLEANSAESSAGVGPFFWRLPYEIRMKIFRYALTSARTLTWPAAPVDSTVSPALLRTCRQIYSEASSLLYKDNCFIFAHPSDCNLFRWLADQNNVQRINIVYFRVREKEIKLWADYFNSKDPMRSLATDLPHLQSIVIYIDQRWWDPLQSPRANFEHWHFNRGVRNMCMALEHKTKAAVTVICRVKIPQAHYYIMLQSHSPGLQEHGRNTLRTGAVELFSAHVLLELNAPEESSSDASAGP